MEDLWFWKPHRSIYSGRVLALQESPHPLQVTCSRSTADFGFSLESQGRALHQTQDLRADEETESLRNMREAFKPFPLIPYLFSLE